MDVAGLGLGQGREQALPQPAARPAVEAVIYGGVGTVVWRTVLPTTAGAQDMDDAAQDTAIGHLEEPLALADFR